MNPAPRGESFFERIIRVLWQRFAARAARLDDPGDAIDIVMQQQLQVIASTRSDLVLVATAQKRLEMLANEYERREQADLVADARAHLEEVSAQRAVLESLIAEMRAQYERLRLRREASRALTIAARAVGDGHASLSAYGNEDRELLLKRAHDTLAEVRARAAALAELRSSGALRGEFD